MRIDKHSLHQAIEAQLSKILTNAIHAARQAYDTATHEENKAENKYDTLGLEAAYLAEGQSKRVAELENELQNFKALKIKDFHDDMEIGVGALICLSAINSTKKYVFYSHVAGGVEVDFQDLKVMLITQSSPLGKVLKNSYLGDVVTINHTQNPISYDIVGLW